MLGGRVDARVRTVVQPGAVPRLTVRGDLALRDVRIGPPDAPPVRIARIADIPAGRDGEAAEVGDLVAYLASDRAAYVTGALIPIDGGLASVQ